MEQSTYAKLIKQLHELDNDEMTVDLCGGVRFSRHDIDGRLPSQLGHRFADNFRRVFSVLSEETM